MLSEPHRAVTFGPSSDGPPRQFRPRHRSTRPARPIMRQTKHHSLDVWSQVRPNSPTPHYMLGAQRHGHPSSVFSVAPLLSSQSRPSSHKRSSRSSHRHHASSSSSLPSRFGHKRSLSDSFKALLGSESPPLHPIKSISSPRKQRRSSISSFVFVHSPSQGHAQISPRDRNVPSPSESTHFVNPVGYPSPPPPETPFSPWNLQDLGYALPSTPHCFHTMPSSTPHNSFPKPSFHWSAATNSSDAWVQPNVYFPLPPRSERILVHSELLSTIGHTLRWNMMLPPQTARSAFSNSVLYQNMSPADSACLSTKYLLRSPACPGTAKIIVLPANNIPGLILWMQRWGPIEVYSSDLTLQTEITVHEVLQSIYEYFQERISSQDAVDVPTASRQLVARSRVKRLGFEARKMDPREWDKLPKRIDVLGLQSIFDGVGMRYTRGLDEPGWKVAELELHLRNLWPIGLSI